MTVLRHARTTLCMLVAIAPMLVLAPAYARPFVPERDDVVVERLPRQLLTDRFARLRAEAGWRNLDGMLSMAWTLIDTARTSGDPRYLGRAQAALTPWWEMANPPPRVLLARATIEQNRHRFHAAIDDLRRLTEAEPDNARAWLTLALVHTAVGDLRSALRSCARLRRLATRTMAAACRSHVESLAGRARSSYDRLVLALANDRRSSPVEAQWALGVLAEIAQRLGMTGRAEAHFQQALRIDPDDLYLRGAYADLLLDTGRPQATLDLLAGEPATDGVLLRRVLAAAALGMSESRRMASRLAAQFEEMAERGDAVHLVAQARFRLHWLADPGSAVEAAARSWEIQRDPRAARILLEAALAAGQRAPARPVLEWMAQTGIEDVRLTRLARDFQRTVR